MVVSKLMGSGPHNGFLFPFVFPGLLSWHYFFPHRKDTSACRFIMSRYSFLWARGPDLTSYNTIERAERGP